MHGKGALLAIIVVFWKETWWSSVAVDDMSWSEMADEGDFPELVRWSGSSSSLRLRVLPRPDPGHTHA